MFLQRIVQFSVSATKCVHTGQVLRASRWTKATRAGPIFSKNIIISKSNGSRQNGKKGAYTFLVPAGLLSFFTDEKEETPEEKLIMTIKRSILAIQRSQYDKAEQMIHLALRMAQDLKDNEGVTYCYDIMANLAMETEKYEKAEKLFVAVMQRLFRAGYKEDDIKMLHISSKLALISTQKGLHDQAEQGFVWTLERIEAKLKATPDDADLYELLGLTKDCYGKLLMIKNRFVEARKLFTEAFNTYSQIYGKNNPDVVDLLNNLAVACISADDLVAAELYIDEAIELAKQFPELRDTGVYEANKGLVYLKKGLVDQAQKLCSAAYRTAKNSQSQDGIDQSSYCLDQIRKAAEGN